MLTPGFEEEASLDLAFDDLFVAEGKGEPSEVVVGIK
jgi:hypothetical protein